MTVQPADVFDRLARLRRETTAVQVSITEIVGMLRTLGLQEQQPAVCELCAFEAAGPLSLAEHLYTSHDDVLPAHWVELDSRIVEPVRPAA